MNTKYFEIRDVGTFIPAIAVRTMTDAPEEIYLLARSGYKNKYPLVILIKLNCSGKSNEASCDPYGWDNRTMQAAHVFIEETFESLKSGDVIDVEFILGITSAPKTSERIEGI